MDAALLVPLISAVVVAVIAGLAAPSWKARIERTATAEARDLAAAEAREVARNEVARQDSSRASDRMDQLLEAYHRDRTEGQLREDRLQHKLDQALDELDRVKGQLRDLRDDFSAYLRGDKAPGGYVLVPAPTWRRARQVLSDLPTEPFTGEAVPPDPT